MNGYVYVHPFHDAGIHIGAQAISSYDKVVTIIVNNVEIEFT